MIIRLSDQIDNLNYAEQQAFKHGISLDTFERQDYFRLMEVMAASPVDDSDDTAGTVN